MSRTNFIAATVAAILSSVSILECKQGYDCHLPVVAESTISEDITLRAAEAKTYASKAGYNTGVCFLIDMKAPSGSRRFRVYDLSNNKVLASGLVTHGRCN